MSAKEPQFLGKSIPFWLNAGIVSILSGVSIIFFMAIGGYVPGFWFGYDLSDTVSRVTMTISIFLVMAGGAGYWLSRMALLSEDHFEWRRSESEQSKKVDASTFIKNQNDRIDLLGVMMSDNAKWIY